MPKYVDLDKVFDRLEDEWGYEGMRDDLYDLPTADVQEVKHGKWVHLGGDEWCCSCCGFGKHTEGSWEKPTAKHCEECGAKMDGE